MSRVEYSTVRTINANFSIKKKVPINLEFLLIFVSSILHPSSKYCKCRKMSSKRRRIIVDEDEPEDSDNKSPNSNDVINRVLQKTKSKSIAKTDNKKGANENQDSKEQPGGIPRKTAKSEEITIPRSKVSNEASSRTIDSKETTTTTNAQPVLSLTQSMLPAPSATGASSSTKPKPAPFRGGGGRPLKFAKAGSQQPDGRNQRISPVRMTESVWDTTKNIQQTLPPLRDEERRVLSTLKTICTKIKLEINPSEDLLSGSFLPNDQMMDCMDDNKQGRVPIFPEDFPAGGPKVCFVLLSMFCEVINLTFYPKEWPLSWWGIVDPLIEKESFSRNRSRADRGHRNDRNPPPRNRGEWQGPPNAFLPQHMEERNGPLQSNARSFPSDRGPGRIPPRY